jgi:hypothetical protein
MIEAMIGFRAVILLLVTLPSICTNPARADEAQDAVELLSYALQCPNKPHKSESRGGTSFFHDTNKFSGTRDFLRIEGSRKFDDDSTANSVVTAQFSDLDETETYATSNDPPQHLVSFSCAKDRPCIKLKIEGDDRNNVFNYQAVEACDAESAKSVKLAIDALIRLNKPNGSQGAARRR